MTSSAIDSNNNDNVIDLFTGKILTEPNQQQIIRLSPELDGLSMLYSNSNPNGEKLYSMKILCWALKANGDVTGMVPWLDKIVPCDMLKDPFNGEWQGYYDSATETIFYEPPIYKQLELENAMPYFSYNDIADPGLVVQEIPDTIGTHAMLDNGGDGNLLLTEVVSWRLLNDGTLQAMLIDEESVSTTPVLPGDPCLYPADNNESFRYFFQHHIANQIKNEDPDALAAIALLFNP